MNGKYLTPTEVGQIVRISADRVSDMFRGKAGTLFNGKRISPEALERETTRWKIEIPPDAIQRRYGSDTAGIYILGSPQHGWYKIGLSDYLKQRVRQISYSVPFELETIAFWPCDDSRLRERYLHTKFAAKRLKNEWFSFTAEDVQNCQSLLKDSWLVMQQFLHPFKAVEREPSMSTGVGKMVEQT